MEDKDATTKSVEQKLNPSKDSRIQEGQRKARVCRITHKRRPVKLIAWGLSDNSFYLLLIMGYVEFLTS